MRPDGRPTHRRFGRLAALQILAIAPTMAAVSRGGHPLAIHPEPTRAASWDLLSVALTKGVTESLLEALRDLVT